MTLFRTYIIISAKQGWDSENYPAASWTKQLFLLGFYRGNGEDLKLPAPPHARPFILFLLLLLLWSLRSLCGHNPSSKDRPDGRSATVPLARSGVPQGSCSPERSRIVVS